MWHVYNLIAVSDSVRASTFRKVTTEGATGSSRSQKIRLTLTLEVVDIYFDTEACALRIKGRNIEENEHVKLGAYHTIDLETNRKFTLSKNEWDTVSIERVELATDPAKSADVAAIGKDCGNFALIVEITVFFCHSDSYVKSKLTIL